jgi:hypothetical protein
LKSCACKGYYEYENSFNCTMCRKEFHYKCLSIVEKYAEEAKENKDGLICSHCQMKMMDPLNKI